MSKTQTNGKNVWFCSIAGIVGAAYSLIRAIWFPGVTLAALRGVPPSQLRLIADAVKIGNWPWALVTMAVLIALILWRRFTGRSWVAAGITGVILGHVAVQVLR